MKEIDYDKLKNLIINSPQFTLDERTVLLALLDNSQNSNTWGAIEW